MYLYSEVVSAGFPSGVVEGVFRDASSLGRHTEVREELTILRFELDFCLAKPQIAPVDHISLLEYLTKVSVSRVGLESRQIPRIDCP